MTLQEALTNREMTYEDWSVQELKSDALLDVLRLLNCYTDLSTPSVEDIHYIGVLSKAVHHLDEETHNVTVTKENKEKWSEKYPEVYSAFCNLIKCFKLFMCAHYSKSNPTQYIPMVFEHHKKLKNAVTNMSDITTEEKLAIMTALNAQN